ncbi:hypothetical protein MXM64_02925 [Kurthia gibsonii]|uniref:hypothetical protein n=1 Tax=Kurthia gibsonii TaxID=33946 RepID=UPI002DB60B0D|nr:hypothetical protein [Kurthia gibsonii]MEB6112000.1 hypothetical protein [Kurthia gibsonii]
MGSKKELVMNVKSIIEAIQEQNKDSALMNIIQFIDNFSSDEYSELKTSEVNTALNEIVQGLEQQDFVLVSDIFEYEILPVLEEN